MLLHALQIKSMQPDQIPAVSDLVFRSFKNNVAPYYSEEGIETFLNYANPLALGERFQKDHFVLVALEQQTIIGMIEIRNHGHVSLLFVEPLEQERGIGKALISKAVARVRQSGPERNALTVNASPNAVEAYKRFGFAPTDAFQEKNGIQFLPMKWEFDKA